MQYITWLYIIVINKYLKKNKNLTNYLLPVINERFSLALSLSLTIDILCIQMPQGCDRVICESIRSLGWTSFILGTLSISWYM